jgi:hypothetical protein
MAHGDVETIGILRGLPRSIVSCQPGTGTSHGSTEILDVSDIVECHDDNVVFHKRVEEHVALALVV